MTTGLRLSNVTDWLSKHSDSATSTKTLVLLRCCRLNSEPFAYNLRYKEGEKHILLSHAQDNLMATQKIRLYIPNILDL